MPAWRLRDYHEADLDQAIQVWDQGRGPGSAEPVFSVAEVMAAARAGQPAVVAEVGDEVVGMAVAQLQGERAWIMLVAIGSLLLLLGGVVRLARSLMSPPASSPRSTTPRQRR